MRGKQRERGREILRERDSQREGERETDRKRHTNREREKERERDLQVNDTNDTIYSISLPRRSSARILKLYLDKQLPQATFQSLFAVNHVGSFSHASFMRTAAL